MTELLDQKSSETGNQWFRMILVVSVAGRPWDLSSGSSFILSKDQCSGEVLSSQIEEPQQKNWCTSIASNTEERLNILEVGGTEKKRDKTRRAGEGGAGGRIRENINMGTGSAASASALASAPATAQLHVSGWHRQRGINEETYTQSATPAAVRRVGGRRVRGVGRQVTW